jgi:hypothetical protein
VFAEEKRKEKKSTWKKRKEKERISLNCSDTMLGNLEKK